MKNVINALLVSLIFSGCMNNPFIEKNFVKESHDLILNNDDDAEFFKQAERTLTNDYVITINEPYFSISVPKLKAASYLEKQLSIKLKDDEINAHSIYALLMDNFEGNVSIDPTVFEADDLPKIIDYVGTAESSLDYLCHVFDCFWEYSNGYLSINTMMVKDWDLSFIPSTFELTAQMQSTSGGGGSEGGENSSGITSTGGQNATFRLDTKMTKLNEIKEAAMALKSEKGVVSMSDGSTILIVKDKPSVINTIDKIILREEFKSSPVVVKIDVLQVQYNNQLDLGLELSGVFNNVSNGTSITNSIGSVVGQSANTLGLNVIDPTSLFFESEALVKAIDEKLSVVNRYSNYDLSLNNQPLIFQNGENVIYEDFSTNTVANVGATTGSEIKQLPIGIDISILPIIKNKDEILIHLNYFNSEVIGQFQRSAINDGPPAFFPQTSDKKQMKSFYVQDGKPLIVTSQIRKQKSTNSRTLSFDKNNKFQAEIVIVTAKIMRNYNVAQR